MITGGTEVIIGVVQEPMFGPLVVFGLGGVATEVLGDHAARLAPLTTADADDLIHPIRAAPLLLGHRGQPPADVAALRDALLRISRLADDLPQVAELDLNPVIARPDGVVAVDARIRVTSPRRSRSVPAPAARGQAPLTACDPVCRPSPAPPERSPAEMTVTAQARAHQRSAPGPRRVLAGRELPVRRADLPDGQPAAGRAAAAGAHQAAAARPLGHHARA